MGSSDCTLRSIGVVTPATTAVPTFRLETTSIGSVERKKPSYLNLACTVNGYSNITNYDSKLRENFRIPRSREVSPIRPLLDYNGTTNNNTNAVSENGDSTICKSKFLTPGYQQKSLVQSPAKMSESKSQSVLRATSYSYTSKTTTTTSSSYIIESSGGDTVDHQSPYHHHYTSVHSSPIQTNGYSRKFLTPNGKTMTNTYTSESTYDSTYTNGSESGAKSFIQQRVERLYGPGALAQGFFTSKRLNKSMTTETSSSESSDVHNNHSLFRTQHNVELLDP